MRVYPKSKVKVDSLDASASRRTFHSVITGGRDTSIRETIDDHLTPFSFAGEMRSALSLLSYGWLPCVLLGLTTGWTMNGSIVGRISFLSISQFFQHLGSTRFLNFIIQSDSYLKMYATASIFYSTSEIVLRGLLKLDYRVMALFYPLSWVVFCYSFRYLYGRTDLIKIHLYLLWQFLYIALFGVLMALIINGHFFYIPLLLLFSEMACRFIFSIVFKDDVYLEALIYCSITHTSMYETIRFNNLCQMVLVSSVTDIAIVAFQNAIFAIIDHTEVVWKIKKKLGRDVELYHIWIHRLECCINVFAYVIPIFYTITAFAVLLGCNMKNQAVSLYFASIGRILLYHYGTELVIEAALSILDRFYQTDVLKRVIFMRAFKNTNTRLIYSTKAIALSAYVYLNFLILTA